MCGTGREEALLRSVGEESAMTGRRGAPTSGVPAQAVCAAMELGERCGQQEPVAWRAGISPLDIPSPDIPGMPDPGISDIDWQWCFPSRRQQAGVSTPVAATAAGARLPQAITAKTKMEIQRRILIRT